MTEITINQAFELGIAAHKAGKMHEADRYYTAILNANPNHPEANHNLGLIAISAGKVEDAIILFKRSIQTDPNTVQFWVSLIKALVTMGHVEEARLYLQRAKDSDIDINHLSSVEIQLLDQTFLANNSHDKLLKPVIEYRESGNFDQAIELCFHNLKRFPKDTTFISHLAYCYLLKGDLKEASHYIEKSRAIDPLNPFVGCNTARLLLKQQLPEEALKIAEVTLTNFPNDPQVKLVTATCLRLCGQVERSLGILDNILETDPEDAHALIQRGLTYLKKNEKEPALSDFKLAHDCKPHIYQTWEILASLLIEKSDYGNAGNLYGKLARKFSKEAKYHFALGICEEQTGNLNAAFTEYRQSIECDAEYTEAYFNLGSLLQRIRFTDPNRALHPLLENLISTGNYVRPKDISNAIVSLVKAEPAVKELLYIYKDGTKEKTAEIAIAKLSQFTLLHKLMRVSQIPDLDFEILLTNLRRLILLNLNSTEETDDTTQFLISLSLHCQFNEYVYYESSEEIAAIGELESSIKNNFDTNTPPRIVDLLCLASYRPIHNYDWKFSPVLFERHPEIEQKFLNHPRIERKIAKDLQLIREVHNPVSEQVKNQYEERPYPRWDLLALPLSSQAISEINSIKQLRVSSKTIFDVREPEILVAGCGTGQQPIYISKLFKNCKITALDLSSASLSYAIRKTNELGIENINYVQGDILDIESVGEEFDIVECTGVLHHMEEPMDGWRALTRTLKPGGLMKIGLYSSLARKAISEIRDEIEKSSIGLSDQQIREFRQTLICSKKEYSRVILDSNDFYTLSSVRDLLFHTIEHQFTLSQILNCLDELNLAFCGFDDMNLIRQFRIDYGNPEDIYDLSKWANFEKNNPNTFVGMYQFWCQQKG